MTGYPSIDKPWLRYYKEEDIITVLYQLFDGDINGADNFIKEANEGKGISFPTSARKYMNYVLPAIIVVVYLKGYYDKFKDSSTVTLVIWMIISVILLILTFSFMLPKKKTK